LMLEEQPVHISESPLRARGIGSFGGGLRKRVNRREWEVPEHQTQMIA
jgi:hypothetical protein